MTSDSSIFSGRARRLPELPASRSPLQRVLGVPITQRGVIGDCLLQCNTQSADMEHGGLPGSILDGTRLRSANSTWLRCAQPGFRCHYLGKNEGILATETSSLFLLYQGECEGDPAGMAYHVSCLASAAAMVTSNHAGISLSHWSHRRVPLG